MYNKITTIIVVLLSIILYGCAEEIITPTAQLYDVTIVNDTDFTLNVSSRLDRFESFSINSGQKKNIEATSTTIFLDMDGNIGNYQLSYDRDSTEYTIYQYEFFIQYKITGTADNVSVTLNNPSGNTEQYNPVSVPHEYNYVKFPDTFYYISAQNQDDSGSVTVEIYEKGRLIESASSEGAYVIATASSSRR